MFIDIKYWLKTDIVVLHSLKLKRLIWGFSGKIEQFGVMFLSGEEYDGHGILLFMKTGERLRKKGHLR